MIVYMLRRAGFTAVTLVALLTFVFIGVRLSGDPATLLIPPDSTEEDRAVLLHELGLDRPVHIQYFTYLEDVSQGDFGRSYRWHAPALTVVTDRLPATLQLAGAAALLSAVVSIPLGVLAAVYRGSIIDVASQFFGVIGQAVPEFWAGILLILIFGVWLDVLPVFGRGSLEHLILPTVCLSGYTLASQMRLTRSAMLDVLDSDYVRMARLKGLSERRVILVHALRNAAIPIVTLMGIRLARLLSGAVVVEVVFAWPGVGRTMVEAILNRDFPVVQAGVLVIAGIFVVINFAVDMSYGVLDPRVRG